MTRPPAASAAEPRHDRRGGAGGVGRGQWVRYPLRVVVDTAAYADADTKVYGKVKALSRGRMCEASVARLAEFTGLSVSAVEKALTRLSRPAPTDGVAELTRRQRSHRATGKGLTNERGTRALEAGERYVGAPVLAADTLRGTLHRLYLLLRYTTHVERRDLTLAEIGQALRHHGGKHAGEPLHERTSSLLLDELQAAGWITQDKRGGYRGRHQITVHDHPVHLVDQPDPAPTPPTPPTPSTPGAEYGAAPDLECGAPAYREDHALTHLGNDAPPGGGVRRRRGDRKWVAVPVENLGAASETFRAAPAQRPYDGPSLSLSPRVWDVLGPVADLLPRISPFVLRTAAREIGRQLDAQVHPDDLHDQILNRRQRTGAANLTADPGRWLLGVALAAWTSPCGLADCVDGLIRNTGTPCKGCAALAVPAWRPRGRTRGHPPSTTAAATALHHCPGCSAPYRPPLRHPTCRLCHHPLTA
ncbi:hypothetical protein [Streptomyces scabiei]|uniref:hypothetical protein n=1 Tax=Streptomyces scabiei TaxID=1930 RepID=UPI001B32CEF0|nr:MULTISPECIES: hypothetical protein [Streptomyces]MBP5890624.1 hypothetical protein [Streptomyces sp. LBUM 1481]MBP5920756.1 hypothetical protein [Streptomyces sp. LBUM 1483]MDX2538860.1 hypothetical protein [Streptomyces scabiei]MDX2802684.1 hypothetical protein [Streptomyces scabiei]MDX3295012.1 hypothetical protein [Streptomyces scabiei]